MIILIEILLTLYILGVVILTIGALLDGDGDDWRAPLVIIFWPFFLVFNIRLGAKHYDSK
jgi:hypothetical protein